jgi:hypothetical protein
MIDVGKHGHAPGLNLGLEPIHRFLRPEAAEYGGQPVWARHGRRSGFQRKEGHDFRFPILLPRSQSCRGPNRLWLRADALVELIRMIFMSVFTSFLTGLIANRPRKLNFRLNRAA